MFEVKGYRTNENCQYGRTENLRTFGDLNSAVKFAKIHLKESRDFQTMVMDKGRMVYANRCGEEYKFIYPNDSVLSELRNACIELCNCFKNNNCFRLEIVEEGGITNIKDVLSGNTLYYNVFGVGKIGATYNEKIAKIVGGILSILFKNINSNIKKFTFVTDNCISRVYFTRSQSEVGSVDVYLDWF